MNEPDQQPRVDFLESLARDLRPVRPALGWAPALGIWTLASLLFVALALVASGPLRAGLADDFAWLRPWLEFGLGVATLVALMAASLEIGVPGGPAAGRLLAPALLLGACWFGITFIGDSMPGPASSMLGKRAHCLAEGLIFSLPPMGLALFLLRRRQLWSHSVAGALAGAAAGALPAIGMQLACMHAPEHALRFHFSPILWIALLGALLGAGLLSHD